MTIGQVDALVCHDRHVVAEDALSVIKKKPGELTPSDKSQLLSILTDSSSLLDVRCADFGCWWESKVYGSLKWAEEAHGNEILEAFVLNWFNVSLDMLGHPEAYCPASPTSTGVPTAQIRANCAKAKTMQHLEWGRRFDQGLGLGPRICKTLTRHFSNNVDRFDYKAGLLLNCGKAIAQHALTNRDLCMPFLGFAVKFGKRFPQESIGLLEEVMSVTGCGPAALLDFCAEYLLSIPWNDGNKATLMTAHERINSWIDAERNGDRVEKMRNAQERCAFHLQGYPPRERHKAGNDLIKISVIAKRPSDTIAIGGTVADISYGAPDILGRGIRFRTADWTFETGRDPRKIRRGQSALLAHDITAMSSKSGATAQLSNPDVVLEWPEGSLRSGSLSIRGFTYRPKYDVDGGGAIVFLDETPSELPQWQRYVSDKLSFVDYGRSGRLS